MRSREHLVQVDVDRVETHVARFHLAEDRVQVRPVVVEEAARLVHDALDVENVLLEHAERGRIREHEPGGARPRDPRKRL